MINEYAYSNREMGQKFYMNRRYSKAMSSNCKLVGMIMV